MAELLIGDVCSRLRGLIKEVRQDGFLTDKFLYSIFKKHASVVIKRLDEKKSMMAMNSVYETLDWVELIECDKVEAGCMGIKSYSTFMKTKEAIPVFTEGKWGPMVRSITSLDGSVIFKLTTHDQYNAVSNSQSFRFNTTQYAWYLNDRMYIAIKPGKIGYPAVRIEGMFDDDISNFKCNYDDKCKPRQEQSLNVPDWILADVERACLQELGFAFQIPSDNMHDNINVTR